MPFTRGDLSELHEAFKTTAEKRIVLPTLGEGTYADRLCHLPVEGTASVTINEHPAGTTRVRGELDMAAPVPQLLLNWMDAAAEDDKDRRQNDLQGVVSCDSRKCVLEFEFAAGAVTTIDATDGHFLWKSDRP